MQAVTIVFLFAFTLPLQSLPVSSTLELSQISSIHKTVYPYGILKG